MLGITPDRSSRWVENAWEMLGKPVVVCGHMYERRTILDVHVLGELEMFVL